MCIIIWIIFLLVSLQKATFQHQFFMCPGLISQYELFLLTCFLVVEHRRSLDLYSSSSFSVSSSFPSRRSRRSANVPNSLVLFCCVTPPYTLTCSAKAKSPLAQVLIWSFCAFPFCAPACVFVCVCITEMFLLSLPHRKLPSCLLWVPASLVVMKETWQPKSRWGDRSSC